MIDTISLRTSLIDLATSGRLSTGFQAKDSVNEIIEILPALSNKRKKLLGQAFEYGKQPNIPDSWRWVPLGKISSYGDTPVKANMSNVTDNTWVLDLEDIKAGGELLIKTRANEKQFAGEKTTFHSGQVLYSKLRPYLKKVLVADEDGISTPELISFDVFGGIIPQYIVYCLLDSFTNRAIDKRSYGIKMPRIDAGFMVNLPVPIPPISEQQYIVESLEKAFALIDTIDDLQQKYESDREILKGKIIDAGIRGKLTEQLPEDGSAEDLYAQIQDEKAKLIKDGKIKKEKPLPEITDEEIPFVIPQNWKWYRLNVLCETIFDIDHKMPSSDPDGVLFLSAKDLLDDGTLNFTRDVKRISREDYMLLSKKGRPKQGDIIYSRIGSLGKARIVDTDIEFLVSYSCCTIRPILVDTRYLQLVLDGEFVLKQAKKKAQSIGVPDLGMKAIKNFMIPVPPLKEQKRIARTIEAFLEQIS